MRKSDKNPIIAKLTKSGEIFIDFPLNHIGQAPVRRFYREELEEIGYLESTKIRATVSNSGRFRFHSYISAFENTATYTNVITEDEREVSVARQHAINPAFMNRIRSTRIIV